MSSPSLDIFATETGTASRAACDRKADIREVLEEWRRKAVKAISRLQREDSLRPALRSFPKPSWGLVRQNRDRRFTVCVWRDDAKAPTQHTIQYFEMTANRAIYHDGWIASTTPARLPWEAIGAAPDPDDYQWELYNLADDFSQAKNVAKDNPETPRDLQALFLIEATKFNVLPLVSSFADRMDPATRLNLLRGQTDFTYYAGMILIPEANSPGVQTKRLHSGSLRSMKASTLARTLEPR
jgi:hypothetical protein